MQAAARVKAPLDEVESYSGFFTTDDALGAPSQPPGGRAACAPHEQLNTRHVHQETKCSHGTFPPRTGTPARRCSSGCRCPARPPAARSARDLAAALTPGSVAATAQGGPGGSSLFGLFSEIGPYSLTCVGRALLAPLLRPSCASLAFPTHLPAHRALSAGTPRAAG